MLRAPMSTKVSAGLAGGMLSSVVGAPPPTGALRIWPVRLSDQYTLLASTAIPDSSISPEVIAVIGPPARGALRTVSEAMSIQ